MAIAPFIVSLTVIALGKELEAGKLPTTSNYTDIWKDLLAETEGVWSDNYPVYRRDFHISSYKRNYNDKLSKILLVGGRNKDSFLDTWIYTPWSNSWFRVATPPQFPFTYASAYELLPSLCSTLVILIYDLNNIWIFDGSTETWSQRKLDSRIFKGMAEPGILSTGAVAMDRSNCTIHGCNSAGSVLFYGVFQKQSSESTRYCLQIRELQCNTQKRQLQCQWTRSIDCIYLPYTIKEVHRVPAVSDGSRGVFYFTSLIATKSNLYLPASVRNYLYEQVCLIEVQHNSWRSKEFACTHSSSNWDTYLKDRYNNDIILKPIRRIVPYNNIVVWKEMLLVFTAFPSTKAVSLRNGARQSSNSMFGLQSDPLPANNSARETVFKTQSSEIVRFHWSMRQPTPTVSLYRCLLNCSVDIDRRRILPSFTKVSSSEPPLKSPNNLFHCTPVYDYTSQSFYVYGGTPIPGQQNLIRSSSGGMWTLSMPSTIWWLIIPEITPTAYISSCGTFSGSNLVLFGGEYQSGAVSNELWLYNPAFRNWKQIKFEKELWPMARAGCSLTASSLPTKMILFGGYSSSRSITKPEIWIVTLDSKGRGIWNITIPVNTRLGPSPRYAHSAVLLGKELVIYGGRSRPSNGMCFSDMWAFSQISHKWREIVSSPRQNTLDRVVSFPDHHCVKTFVLPYGMNKVVLFQSRYHLEPLANARVVSSVWMMDVNKKITTPILSPNQSIIVQAAGIWAGTLVYAGQYNTGAGSKTKGALLTIRQSCKPGASQRHGPGNGPCEPCPVASYSQTTLSISECIGCPVGATTKGPGTISMSSCVCDKAHCVHGSCKAVANDDGGTVFGCICSFGFLGYRCQQINYAVIVIPLLLSSVVITALSCCGIRTARHRRAKQQTQRELEETQRAFTIQPEEVQLECRLDESCPGGYGQVHKAKYRDMTVAVKHLQLEMAEWAQFRKEFLREIQFMRTIRHPNIVMFIGAGQDTENRPFLVLEYMSGGALLSLLQNEEIHLTKEDRLQFALDTARGMNYLHTLQPPRIHRDLKSANLLLSCTRQVKVADFGSARLIPRPGSAATRRARRRPMNRSLEVKDGYHQSTTLTQRLLTETAQLTSSHIGTAAWRSPELWRTMPYGTATDVYSFAIVLWEIWTRQTPFSGPRYTFDIQLERDVLNGVRPVIPDGTPDNLRILMEQCWQDKPNDRPQFKDVVLKLTSMVHATRQQPESVTHDRLDTLVGPKCGAVEMIELNEM